MLTEIRQLYEFNSWANRRFLEAVSVLSDEEFSRDLGSSFPSVGATLTHMLDAEWIWLQRWRGTSPAGVPTEWDTSTPAALRAEWEAFADEQRRFLESLTEDRLLAEIQYRNTAGQPFANQLWEMLRHVVNHATYHRGQVATMLRQLGRAVPVTDLIAFLRERQQPGPP